MNERPSTALRDLNFKVHPDFHKKFKLAAAHHEIAMSSFLQMLFYDWLNQPGQKAIRRAVEGTRSPRRNFR